MQAALLAKILSAFPKANILKLAQLKGLGAKTLEQLTAEDAASVFDALGVAPDSRVAQVLGLMLSKEDQSKVILDVIQDPSIVEAMVSASAEPDPVEEIQPVSLCPNCGTWHI